MLSSLQFVCITDRFVPVNKFCLSFEIITPFFPATLDDILNYSKFSNKRANRPWFGARAWIQWVATCDGSICGFIFYVNGHWQPILLSSLLLNYWWFHHDIITSRFFFYRVQVVVTCRKNGVLLFRSHTMNGRVNLWVQFKEKSHWFLFLVYFHRPVKIVKRLFFLFFPLQFAAAAAAAAPLKNLDQIR